MTWDDDFMCFAMGAFSEMRLMVEGAISFFEDDTGILCRLAQDTDEWDANRALNDIGTALYELRRYITALQEAHYKAEHQPQNTGNENT